MSWLVVFGKSRESNTRQLAFVISRENAFAKIIMHPDDWDRPNDPNRNPFDKTKYPDELNNDQLFGVLTANLQFHFGEIMEFDTEFAAKKLVESITIENAGASRSKPDHSIETANRSMRDILNELADILDRQEQNQLAEINGIKQLIAELHDEIAQIQIDLSSLEPITKTAVTGTKEPKQRTESAKTTSRRSSAKPTGSSKKKGK